jgi:predicted anti-sigma-YlaC factor YlaD
MDCKEIRELLPDLAAGMEVATPEVRKHLASCDACSTQFHDFQKTMALLDEWQAPEPSAYFDTRLQARLREEMARPAESWLRRMMPSRYLRPAWAALAAAVVLMAALAIGNRTYFVETEAIATRPPTLGLPVQPGTAVGDLQALDKNDDLYADFDVLDELQVQDDGAETQ